MDHLHGNLKHNDYGLEIMDRQLACIDEHLGVTFKTPKPPANLASPIVIAGLDPDSIS